MTKSKMAMRTLKYFIIVITLLCLAGSCKQRKRLELIESFETATRIYYEGDANAAANALASFVGGVEKNIEVAERSTEAQYKKLLDMSWLRLASVYQAEGRSDQYEQAINRAIYYFDQDPNFASDKEYQQNKRNCILKLLDRIERTNMPEWKRKLEQR